MLLTVRVTQLTWNLFKKSLVIFVLTVPPLLQKMLNTRQTNLYSTIQSVRDRKYGNQFFLKRRGD